MPVGVSAYIPLATVTLGSSASSVTFSSIPATYRDLVLVIAGSHSGDSSAAIRLNSDSGSNYSGVRTQGNGSTAASGTYTSNSLAIQQIFYTANTQVNYQVQLMDYSATDKHKTVLVRANSSANATAMEAHRWANTNAITTVYVESTVANFNAGSTFNLYGIQS